MNVVVSGWIGLSISEHQGPEIFWEDDPPTLKKIVRGHINPNTNFKIKKTSQHHKQPAIHFSAAAFSRFDETTAHL